jgi:hypothetical protein
MGPHDLGGPESWHISHLVSHIFLCKYLRFCICTVSSGIRVCKVTPPHAYSHKGEAAVQLRPIRNLGARRRWVVNTTPRPVYLLERPGTHCIGDWVGFGDGLHRHGKSRLQRDSIPRPSRPLASRCTFYAIPAATMRKSAP